ncbi:uncharacterized protein LOC107411756 isoform X1 [Ziziphus jujuba]|uniref:Uncharacterized protein LOC107411756 isoform X1 n=1 Tax=Ziziphus jujuba TaxID=326968 RepID=A0A6P3ZBK2_ZIZJJ|nr:uncharacterized protein LOC107411756 isoform X1 [Ziziphus jujuba]
MARVPTKHGRDQALDFQGFLNDLQDWELSLKDKDKKMRPQASDKVSSSGKTRVTGEDRKRGSGPYDYARSYDAINSISSSFSSDDSLPDAASEKELGNEYFKQKKFKEAIDCYSRSIALSPTAVAFANRAMAYLKIKSYQEAENDCTEALNLDDRYIKAYSRRATARKELGKLKECLEDAEFAMRLEPHNQEIKKQYSEAKSLYEKNILQKASVALENTVQKFQKVGKSDAKVNGQGTHPVSVQEIQEGRTSDAKVNGHPIQPVSIATQSTEIAAAQDRSKQRNHVTRKQELQTSVQEIASRAASRAKIEAAKNITPPKSAYQFEVSWRGISGDPALQASLLKAVPPSELPQIFKNALTVPILVDIVKCVATFFGEEMDLAVSFLENLTKVSRFDVLMMCLTSTYRADLAKLWDEVFCNEAAPVEYVEILDKLRSKYCLK